MAKKRAGWERLLYYGNYGSTAATQISSNLIDVDFKVTKEYHATTDRGDGSAAPKKTEQPHETGVDLSFKMRYKDGDSNMSTLLAAAEVDTLKAFKVVRYTGGDTEFDGDCYLEYDAPGPLNDGQIITFTCHATDDGGRAWAFS